MIYRKTGSNISLESAGFAGGRFVAKETADGGKVIVPMIHVTDHLGSVREVVDGVSGEVVETNDYYPFGSRWNTTASLTDQSNRFRYNSKEEQFNFGTPYIDYGARQYDPVVGRWFAQDPLAEKYYGISPYAFCNNNSANLVDPDGMASGDPVREPDIRRNKASNLMGEGIRNYKGKYTNHQGFDYYAAKGTDVLSVLDGVVFAVVEDNGAYGTTLTIEHTDQQNNTVYSFYAHLDNVNVNIGENVTEGQVVAKSGISGNAKGLQGLDQHLHFELRSLPENIKGLTGKLDPNTVVDTKFISQDPEVRPQTQVGIIKIYKDGTEEYKDVIR